MENSSSIDAAPSMDPTARGLIRSLGLEALPGEGGWFRRTWTSEARSNDGSRAAASAIFFLLTNDKAGFSALHRLDVEELYHFYAGDPVELHLFSEDRGHELLRLGSEPESGCLPQALAPAGVWQASRLAQGGAWALLGTTCAPEFSESGFVLGGREELSRLFPGQGPLIELLTRA